MNFSSPFLGEIVVTCLKKTINSVIYLPPDSNKLDELLESTNGILRNTSRENKSCCMLGDRNIYLSSNTDASINFLNIMYLFCFGQCIYIPTTPNTDDGYLTTSLINNILCDPNGSCLFTAGSPTDTVSTQNFQTFSTRQTPHLGD